MFIFFKYSTVCSYEDESELIVKDWVHHAAAADAPCTVFNLLNVAAQAAGCPPVRRQPLWQDNLIKKTNTATKRGASEIFNFSRFLKYCNKNASFRDPFSNNFGSETLEKFV